MIKKMTKEQLKKHLEEVNLEIIEVRRKARMEVDQLQADNHRLRGNIITKDNALHNLREELKNCITKDFCLEIVKASHGGNK